jgi:prefoldin subunit 5
MKAWQEIKNELDERKAKLKIYIKQAEQLRRVTKSQDGKMLNIRVYKSIEEISSKELSAYKQDNRIAFYVQKPWREIFCPKYDTITTNKRFDFAKFNKELSNLVQYYRQDIAEIESDLLIGERVFSEIEKTKAYLDQLKGQLSTHTRYTYVR